MEFDRLKVTFVHTSNKILVSLIIATDERFSSETKSPYIPLAIQSIHNITCIKCTGDFKCSKPTTPPQQRLPYPGIINDSAVSIPDVTS